MEIFSPEGGKCEADAMSDPRDASGYSASDWISMGFLATPRLAALCHGVSILRYARLANGELLARGKTVTGFANVEEDFAGNAVWGMGLLERGRHLMPWRIEDVLKEAGANYIQAGMWRAFACRDGNLITGQQNFSGTATAELVIRALGE